MAVTERIEELLASVLQEMGYGIVRIQLSGGMRPTLQIMIERLDEQPVSIDDCVAVSRQASAMLDVADPIKDSYRLEVSSPGLDRPLVKKADFQRFAGEIIKLQTRDPLDGRKRFEGRLEGVEGDDVLLTWDEAQPVLRVPYAQVAKAKIVPEEFM
ncbi:MAG: ribosome maturation factor RimP [Holosporales bacterium]